MYMQEIAMVNCHTPHGKLYLIKKCQLHLTAERKTVLKFCAPCIIVAYHKQWFDWSDGEGLFGPSPHDVHHDFIIPSMDPPR